MKANNSLYVWLLHMHAYFFMLGSINLFEHPNVRVCISFVEFCVCDT